MFGLGDGGSAKTIGIVCLLGIMASIDLDMGIANAEDTAPGSDGFQGVVDKHWNDHRLFEAKYFELCAVCHGDTFSGTPQGPALVGVELAGGTEIEELVKSISQGSPARGMPEWESVLTERQIRNLALFIAERRQNLTYESYDSAPVNVPESVVSTSLHGFKIDVLLTGLNALVFSIAPLPDGRLLVTERTRGLGIVDLDKSGLDLVKGTPPVYDDVSGQGVGALGIGQLLEVKPHPEYEENGWIYLSYGERCSGCNALSKISGDDVSMVKVVRGRLSGTHWIDEEAVWSVDKQSYSTIRDNSKAGRLTFDQEGHLFISISVNAIPPEAGIQDLDQPNGKIHRVRDNGDIPEDNPYAGHGDAMPSIWSIGHRTPHGLEYDPVTRRLWSTEMGPRGGDELNLIKAGENYGWPLVSNGVNYNGTPVAYGEVLGIEFDPDSLTDPVYDWTPSPAISSFIVYQGDEFPEWKGDFVSGTLKATKLLRLREHNGKIIEHEVLLDDIARIRDVEEDGEGRILLLLEHNSGSQIVRMSVATTRTMVQ